MTKYLIFFRCCSNLKIKTCFRSNQGIAMIPLVTYMYKKYVLYVNVLSGNLLNNRGVPNKQEIKIRRHFPM